MIFVIEFKAFGNCLFIRTQVGVARNKPNAERVLFVEGEVNNADAITNKVYGRRKYKNKKSTQATVGSGPIDRRGW